MKSPDLSERPHLAERLKILERRGLYLLLVPETGAWTVVGESGHEIAALCSGRRTVSEVAGFWGRRWGLPPGEALAEVTGYLGELAQAGLLEETPPGPAPSAPCAGEVAIHLTARCNLRCRHCYARSGPDRAESLRLPAVLGLLEQAAPYAKAFVFSGGEPLLYPHWREVLTRARQLSGVKLVTNASLLDAEVADFLAQQDIAVQISLDGATAQVHDRLRGPGSFAAVHAAVERLTRRRHGGAVRLGCTLTRENLAQASAVLDVALEWGLGGVHFMPLNRHGRAADNWAALGVTPAEAADTYRLLSARRRSLRGLLEVTGCVGDYVERTLQADGRARCPVGENLMVECTGELYPCILLTSPQFYLGRLSDLPAPAAYQTPTRRDAREAVAQRLESAPTCASCDWRRLCGGACPGMALWRGGSLQADDGLCELRRELYRETIFTWAEEICDQSARAVGERAA